MLHDLRRSRERVLAALARQAQVFGTDTRDHRAPLARRLPSDGVRWRASKPQRPRIRSIADHDLRPIRAAQEPRAEEVHGGAADEPGDEEVGWLVIEFARRAQ